MKWKFYTFLVERKQFFWPVWIIRRMFSCIIKFSINFFIFFSRFSSRRINNKKSDERFKEKKNMKRIMEKKRNRKKLSQKKKEEKTRNKIFLHWKSGINVINKIELTENGYILSRKTDMRRLPYDWCDWLISNSSSRLFTALLYHKGDTRSGLGTRGVLHAAICASHIDTSACK